MKINNINIFSSASELYLSNGDQDLIKIKGGDKELLERLIENLIEHENVGKVFDIMKDDFLKDISYFNSMINFLRENGVFQEDPVREQLIIKTLIVGKFDDIDAIRVPLGEVCLRNNLQMEVIDVVESWDRASTNFSYKPDLIVVFAPVYTSLESLEHLSKMAYLNKIPVLHASLESAGFLLGPIFDAELHTASLSCYFKRKIAGMQSAENYLSAFRMNNRKHHLHFMNIKSHPSFNVLMEFIGKELGCYYLLNKRSHLVGQEVEFNSFFFTMKTTRIFKTANFEYNSL